MVQARTTRLDPQLFAQALAVLERERPSPRQEQLFRLLNQLVWGAFAFSALYVLLRLLVLLRVFEVSQIEARPIGLTAAFLCLSIIPVFVLNWGLVQKLRRAARLRRRLAPSWKRRLQDLFSARRGRHRFANLATLALSAVVGLPAGLFGVLGLIFELSRTPMIRPLVALAAAQAALGLSCFLLYFMARGRERLEVIIELRSSLLGGRNAANEAELALEDYDEIARIERAQIGRDRKGSLKAAAKSAQQTGYSSRESRAVRDAKSALAPAVLMEVLAGIDRLIADPPLTGTKPEAGPDISYVRVQDTPLEIGYIVDHEAREVRVLSLQASEARRASNTGIRSENDGRV